MSWTTPKTDWTSNDYFTAVDFNRIKNNLQYLRDMAITIFDPFDIVSLGNDRTYADYFYADEINQMCANFNIINKHTINETYDEFPVYYDNGNTMTYVELNVLESAILDLKYKLSVWLNDRYRMFVWNFGIGGGMQ